MLVEDQMSALFDYTRESFASKADDVLSVQDEVEVLEAHAKWERDKLNEQFPKDEC